MSTSPTAAIHSTQCGVSSSPPSITGFRIDNEYKANWLVRKVLDARRYAEKVEAWAAAETRRAKRIEDRLISRFGADLQQWFDSAVSERSDRLKSIRLPAGRLGYRATPATLRIDDQVRVAEWCKRHLPNAMRVAIYAEGGDAIALLDALHGFKGATHVEERFSLQQLKLLLKTTGELADGTSLRPQEQRFYVK